MHLAQKLTVERKGAIRGEGWQLLGPPPSFAPLFLLDAQTHLGMKEGEWEGPGLLR